MADEADAVGIGGEDLEFIGMAEVLVDPAAALAAGRDQDRLGKPEAADDGGGIGGLVALVFAFAGDDGAIGRPFGLARTDGFGIGLRQRSQCKLASAVLAEQADGIGPALPAMPHQPGIATKPVLRRLQLRRRRPALAGEAVVRCRAGDRRSAA